MNRHRPAPGIPLRRPIAAAVGLAVFASSCVSGTKPQQPRAVASTVAPTAPTTTIRVKSGGTLIYATDQEPAGFNVNTSAANTALDRAIMDQVWPSVFHVTPDLNVVLNTDFVTSAKLTSQNPQTVVMTINPAATWSDGVPIVADDFFWFWIEQRNPSLTKDSCSDPKCTTNGLAIDDAGDGAGYHSIQSVVGSNDSRTVTVVFSEAYADWKSLWRDVVPAHLVGKVGWNKGFDSGDPSVVVSGGPFKIQSFNKGTDLTLVPNDKYWGKFPHLDAIVFRFLIDPARQVTALQNKDVDMIYTPPDAQTVKAVQAIAGIRSTVTLGPQLDQLEFNLMTPGLSDEVVRLAIATAIDRPSLLGGTVGLSTGNVQIDNNRVFIRGDPRYRDTSGGLYDHGDAAKARQMLEADGYRLGADGIYVKGGAKLSFHISAAAADPLAQQTETLLSGQLKQSGVELKIGNDVGPTAGSPASSPQSDIAIVTSDLTPFPSAASVFYSEVGQQFGQPQDGPIASLFHLGTRELDSTMQAGDFNEADALMWKGMYSLPLYRLPTLLAVRDGFVNVADNVTADGPFWNAGTWGLRPGAVG